MSETVTAETTGPISADRAEQIFREEIQKFLFRFRYLVEEEIRRIPGVTAAPHLNRTDTAAYCGCGVNKVDALSRKGQLKASYLGKQPLFTKKNILELIKSETISANRDRAQAVIDKQSQNQ